MIGKKKEGVAQVKYICTKSARFGDRSFQPGEYIEVPEDVMVPDEFMPLVLEGPNGTVETGPFFFCLKECSRHGRTFKPGEIWDRYSFKEAPPEGPLFVPLADKDLYEMITVSNHDREYRLKAGESVFAKLSEQIEVMNYERASTVLLDAKDAGMLTVGEYSLLYNKINEKQTSKNTV